jgi:hypothetical protein
LFLIDFMISKTYTLSTAQSKTQFVAEA